MGGWQDVRPTGGSKSPPPVKYAVAQPVTFSTGTGFTSQTAVTVDELDPGQVPSCWGGHPLDPGQAPSCWGGHPLDLVRASHK